MVDTSHLNSQASTSTVTHGMATAQVVLEPRKGGLFSDGIPGCWNRRSIASKASQTTATSSICFSDSKVYCPKIFNSQSRIRVRLYSMDASQSLDERFFRRRLEDAIGFRRHLGYLEPSDACRVVFSEADGVSGLVVDRYADYLAVQPTALAMARRIEM